MHWCNLKKKQCKIDKIFFKTKFLIKEFNCSSYLIIQPSFFLFFEEQQQEQEQKIKIELKIKKVFNSILSGRRKQKRQVDWRSSKKERLSYIIVTIKLKRQIKRSLQFKIQVDLVMCSLFICEFECLRLKLWNISLSLQSFLVFLYAN